MRPPHTSDATEKAWGTSLLKLSSWFARTQRGDTKGALVTGERGADELDVGLMLRAGRWIRLCTLEDRAAPKFPITEGLTLEAVQPFPSADSVTCLPQKTWSHISKELGDAFS
ncbi:hypothetical protein H920_18716 [Fukomys damarensis]|uniref:Uncharacterized protein n=1 Tax=Fukomys damarensis TaxID=885580 RepID=A0A091CM40_FUKDA|nr:hypothetical protein H920_18716 [Fukomys damarensis]